MREVQFERAALTHQPSPVQISGAATLAIVTRSADTLHAVDSVDGSAWGITAPLHNELANLVAYNEDIPVTTNISDAEVAQLRWSGTDLVVLTNNLNVLVLRRASTRKDDYRVVWNVNRFLAQHRGIAVEKIIAFADLLALRLHSVAVHGEYVAVGAEDGSVTVLRLARGGIEVAAGPIPVGDKRVVGLEWSSGAIGGPDSRLAAVLNDNSVSVYDVATDGARGITVGKCRIVKPPARQLVSLVRFHADTLAIVSTDKLQVVDLHNLVSDETPLGTMYAVTDLCFIPARDVGILLVNGLDYMGKFDLVGGTLVRSFVVCYNSPQALESISEPYLASLKKKLVGLLARHNRISIRAMQVDPLSRVMTVGYAKNDPPQEYRRMKQTHFKVVQVPLDLDLDFALVRQIDFSTTSPRHVINLANVTKVDIGSWQDQFAAVALSAVSIDPAAGLADNLEANFQRNTTALGLLHTAYQLHSYLGIAVVPKAALEATLLQFVAQIYTRYVEDAGADLTNKFDLAIYQSYKTLLTGAPSATVPDSKFTFHKGELSMSFAFDGPDLETIVSVEDKMPFKRCAVTLLPLLELHNFKSDSSPEKTVVNLENLERNDHVGNLTTELLKRFNEVCIYSGDQLYRM